MEKCLQAPPKHWSCASPCIRPAGHLQTEYRKYIKRVKMHKKLTYKIPMTALTITVVPGTEHECADGRKWPFRHINEKFAGMDTPPHA